MDVKFKITVWKFPLITTANIGKWYRRRSFTSVGVRLWGKVRDIRWKLWMETWQHCSSCNYFIKKYQMLQATCIEVKRSRIHFDVNVTRNDQEFYLWTKQIILIAIWQPANHKYLPLPTCFRAMIIHASSGLKTLSTIEFITSAPMTKSRKQDYVQK